MQKNKQVLLIIFLAILTRFPAMEIYSLWFDEHLTANAAMSQNLTELLEIIYKYESIPPLFFIIEKIFATLGGYSEFSLRLFPVISDCISALVIFLIFDIYNIKGLAFKASLLYIFSGFFIYYATDARVYAIQITMSLLSIFFILKRVKENKLVYLYLSGIFIAIAMQLHYYSAILSFSLILAYIITYKRVKESFVLIVPTLISGILVLPHFLQQYALQTNGQKTELIKMAVVAIPYIPIKTMLGPAIHKLNSPNPLMAIDYIAILFIGVCISLFIISQFKRKKGVPQTHTSILLVTFLSLSFISHIALGFKYPALHPRYTAYSFALLPSLLIVLTRHTPKLQVSILYFYISINIVGFLFNSLNPDLPYRRPWKEIVSSLDSYASDNAVVISSKMGVLSIPYYSQKTYRYIELSAQLDKRVQIGKYEDKQFQGHTIESYKTSTANESSIVELLKNKKSGFYIHLATHREKEDVLFNQLSQDIDFTTLEVFPTNQGPVYITQWRVK